MSFTATTTTATTADAATTSETINLYPKNGSFKFTLNTKKTTSGDVECELACIDLPEDHSTQVNLVRAAAEVFIEIINENNKRRNVDDEDLAAQTFKRIAPTFKRTADDLATHLVDANIDIDADSSESD